MNFELNEEQVMLRKMARDYLATKCPGSTVREMMEDERGYHEELWKEIAKLGWLGLSFPAKYGGADGNFLDLTILLEEMGRVVFPGPFFSTIVLAGFTLLYGANEEHKKDYLSRICRGDLIATLALTEADTSIEASAVQMEARAESGHYVLNGNKMFVTDANVSDLIICAARSNGNNADGITLFLVDSKTPGVGIKPLRTFDGSRPCDVVFKNVKVPEANIIGQMGKGWETIAKVLQYAAIGTCAQALGGAQRLLELSIAYSNDRKQFGKLIGTFQAIQHHCANMATDVDGMRLTTYQAAWLLSENIPCSREVSIAKGWASEAYKRVSLLGLKVHGGMGFMEDHDVSLFFRKAATYDSSFGDADHHRDILARKLDTT